MKLIRFHENAEHVTRFQQRTVAFPQSHTNAGHTFQLSAAFTADAIMAELPVGLDQDWHVAPARQFVIVLSGLLEVETNDGEIRRWSAGGMFMADDTRGQGHRTRVIEGPVRLMFLRVAPDFDPNLIAPT